MQTPNVCSGILTGNMDLRSVIKEKALKHREFYRCLLSSANTYGSSSVNERKMSSSVLNETKLNSGDRKQKCLHFKSTLTTGEISINSEGSVGRNYRQRRRGVYEISTVEDSLDETLIEFKSVKQLREHYQTMLEKTYKNLSLNDKDCTPVKSPDLLVPPSSGYCSSSASGGSDDEKDKNCFRKGLRRSASSDSAVHSDEEYPNLSNWTEKRDDDSPVEGK